MDEDQAARLIAAFTGRDPRAGEAAAAAAQGARSVVHCARSRAVPPKALFRVEPDDHATFFAGLRADRPS